RAGGTRAGATFGQEMRRMYDASSIKPLIDRTGAAFLSFRTSAAELWTKLSTNPLKTIGDGLKTVLGSIKSSIVLNATNAWTNLTTSLQAFKTSVMSTGFIKAIQLVFHPNAAIAGQARGAWGSVFSNVISQIGKGLKALTTLAIEAGVALALMFLARSDFSNPVQESINKMALAINASLTSIGESFKRMDKAAKNSGDTIDQVATGIRNLSDSLPSKGLQVDIGFVFGGKSQGYTMDDVIKSVNRALAENSKEGLNDYEGTIYDLVKYSGNPGVDIGDKRVAKYLEKNPKLREALVRDTDYKMTEAATQIVLNLKSLDDNIVSYKQQIKNLNLTQETKEIKAQSLQQNNEEINKVDKEIDELRAKKIALLDQNTYDSQEKAKKIDKEINLKNKERSKLSEENDKIIKDFDDMIEQGKKIQKDAEDYPRELRDMFIQKGKEIQKIGEDGKKIFLELIPVKPLELIYAETKKALRKVEIAYE
ncbi:hypothetical protein EBU91_04710, partial [bacterium]|nr:hypothetical protein [bacterium]